MSSVSPSASAGFGLRRALIRNRGALIAAGVLAILLFIVDWISAGPLTYFDVSFLSSGGATSALAAIGQTIVILSGGFDLSAGAVISLVNAVLASSMDPMAPGASILLWTAVGIGVGMAVGAFNGFFIAVLRMQPIVVTLSTMFILQGVTLLVMDKPGGFVSPDLGTFYLGDAITGWLPMPLVVIGVVLLAWFWLKGTRFGTALYAVGSDADSAAAVGINVVLVRFAVYVIAGGCYGLAGVFISAQTGSGDPLVGNPLLLSMFAAVVVGGTRLGGGQGGPVGSVFGAYILMMVVNILLVLNVSAYYSTIAEGTILVLAALAGSLSHASVLAVQLRAARARLAAWRAGILPSQLEPIDRRLKIAGPSHGNPDTASPRPAFHVRNAETLRYALPAYVCLLIIVVVTQIWLGRAILNPGYWNSLLVLSSFLAVLALGQGTVILTGGLDLSVPWTIGISGIILAGMVNGSDAALLYALPVVLVMACAIGFANGFGIVYLGISPIVMTLATNGILQGFALLYSQGTPAGFSSPMLRWFMTAKLGFVTPVVLLMVVFVVVAVLLLGRTPFGRRVYGIGNGLRAARLSGIGVERTLILVYMLSAVCAAVVGIMLTGFSGQASLGMGDDYLLPSIAVVVVGGALITGGRGHYLGMLGGVLLLTALQMLLAGTTLPYATRAILYGLVVLGAVMALRERQLQ
ncbi:MULTISPECIES: ABC transporter permease [Mesorhizobium]|uniref:Inner-membrane translocator n=1 Tax=Mesorhizobium opportunistum (strain LMG 24607 / HAMBI 3007 / WSM2075) TaxID=536019 RepID=F7Y4P5_MESOW|nr:MULTISPECIES: ABC transporter permease [Mesorhizobium]AEH88448.1 inner-membrane translocator [Mesorhizobium opportunistum WSM2075]MCA0030584.1 ABC transporter permease [Mesorhizobium sp. B263B2A]